MYIKTTGSAMLACADSPTPEGGPSTLSMEVLMLTLVPTFSMTGTFGGIKKKDRSYMENT